MYSVVITRKKTGKVVAQVQVQLSGMNYPPTPAEYHAEALKTAIDDKLVEANARKDDFNFEIVPVTLRDAFSHSQPKGKSS